MDRIDNVKSIKPKLFYCLVCDTDKTYSRKSGTFKIYYNNNCIYLKCCKCGTKYKINDINIFKKIKVYK